MYGILYFGNFGIKFPETLFIIVPVTTIAWLVTVFITKPVDESKLMSFYKRVHPGGKGWRKISDKMPEVTPDSGYAYLFSSWALGIILVYMFLFGIGKIILADYFIGVIYLALGTIAGILIFKNLDKLGWEVNTAG